MANTPATGWKMVIHGGAGIMERAVMTAEQERDIRSGLADALKAGADILAGGGSALDAVEAAVNALEDNPYFNSGRGAVLTYEGGIELDASIMKGDDLDAGAVTGVSGVRNPVTLARAVMEQSPHVMLAGEGADQFGREKGVEQAPPGWFELPERRRQLEQVKANGEHWFDVDMKFGTVGAVALDSSRHTAAATSTGGITGKRWGRVGDTPLIGSGTYADDRAGAVSATGSGEFFMREVVAYQICARIRMLGQSPREAADTVMAEVAELGGNGGVIFVSPAGEAGWSFNSSGMYRGRASAEGSEVAIFGDE
jgi:beta-aspartyl-peptidase (threonine type)